MTNPVPPNLRFLGPLRVTRDGRPVPLPQSQKTRALLAYLAMTGRPQRRDRLCTMFWDVTDDPRGALRWSLSKLRVLDDPDAKRIVSERDTVAFEPAGAHIDGLEVVRAVAAGLDELSIERLEELASTFQGDFLEGLELEDFDDFRAWRVAERERFRGMRLQILRALVGRLEASPERALPAAREVVRLASDDEHARATLVRLLAALGLREEAREHYVLGRRQLDQSGAKSGVLEAVWRRVAAAPPRQAHDPSSGGSRQEVRYCTAPDGVRIAYATLGDGPPLIKTANWMTHLEHDWRSPLWRHLARELSGEFRLVRYDQRGNGLSDLEIEDFSLDACVGDLEAVVDAAGVPRFPLLGISQGCRVAIAYAVRHPERVSHLLLYGGSARGWKHRSKAARERREGLQALIREGWGRDLPAFRQVFTTLFMPNASTEQASWFNELQRVSTTPENAVRITEAASDVDVSELLPQVRAPTLVMHATRDAMVPFEEARHLAAGIPDSRLVALESENHLLLDDEAAFGRFLSELRLFLSDGNQPPIPR